MHRAGTDPPKRPRSSLLCRHHIEFLRRVGYPRMRVLTDDDFNDLIRAAVHYGWYGFRAGVLPETATKRFAVLMKRQQQ